MKAFRIRKKGRLDKYEIREGGDAEWNGSLVATLTKAIFGGRISGGWDGMEFGGVWKTTWHPTIDSAIRYYTAKKTDDRIMDKMEALL